MLEKALSGNRNYWLWLLSLLVAIGLGFLFYLQQLKHGLTITGLSRDVSWGFYIAQFTYLVGVAASAVMLVLPYYLHDYKKFGKIVILGEFLAVSAVSMCILFIFVDLGQPFRVMNVVLHPTPNSIMFWDMIVLMGYFLLNIVIGWTTLGAERKGLPAPGWVKPLIYLSIPWAVSIHTVTAFLYAGLPGRHLWLTAIMAARFLASAFASGPALLILLCLLVRKLSKFDPGKEAIQTLAKIVTYAMLTNVFFLALEFFTAFYSGIPGHMHPLQYLFFGLHGHGKLIPFMWSFVVLAIIGLALLLVPAWRQREDLLAYAAGAIVISTWLDKGMGLVVGGFIPNPFEQVVEYAPTGPELMITLGVWAIGLLILTILYKVAVGVKEETAL
ncbi:MAG: NrfD/PsrC family molybdoenzyme membrane anchor subunit [bacterium]|nr:NrfD/PsrC family molybdoenzyme membrane anchor subunit [bacterium]